ncbi:MAG: ATP-binding protein [Desulfobacterales bacterium]|nr:ATP-binding protein [Desulfobacterales bacterium]
MEKILVSHNRHWDHAYTGLYQRNLFQKLIKNLSVKHIQVLQGIRRSGKSTLFKLVINNLIESCDPMEILYLNLEDPFFIKYNKMPEKLYEIVETAQKMTGKKVRYFFLDEVQAITGWEKYVKTVYDNEEFKKIFITGSNSSLLNGEFATLLTGRFLSLMVYPLSFSELLKINGITSYVQLVQNKANVLAIVDTMLKYGSFVEVFDNNEELKRDIISSYYDTILLKDCVSNNYIRDIKSFKELSYYLISNIASPFSYSSLAKAINIHDKSAKEFVQYLQQAYLLSELKLFSWSLKEQQNNKKKPYLIDNGFINLSFQFSSNSGTLLENLVFSEFHKTGKDLYFYNKGFDCDFIIKNKDNTLEAVQVCYELNDQNKKREVGALKKIDNYYKTSSKSIITYNQEIKVEGIKVVPFWKYFHDFRNVDELTSATKLR